ncbi:hypothetical protein MBLNU457_4815t2 [Dothideomycetes sp. NU457]
MPFRSSFPASSKHTVDSAGVGIPPSPVSNYTSKPRNGLAEHSETEPTDGQSKPKTSLRNALFHSISKGRHSQRPRTSQSTSSNTSYHDELGTMIDATGPKGRRERTLIGAECSVCDEPLEHTLRGERILQLSCSHVAHEACFYEYIKEFDSQTCPTCNAPLSVDTSRGGNLDFEKLNHLVRASHQLSSQQSPYTTPSILQQAHTPSLRQAPNTPSVHHTPDLRHTPALSGFRDSPRAGSGWDQQSARSHPRGMHSANNSQSYSDPHGRIRSQDGYGQHSRNDSTATGAHSAATDYSEGHVANTRKHDYDVQSMEMSVSSPRITAKNPIPPPTVTVRSEFPTINRSRAPQSITCLVTVEVVDGNWTADPEDIRGPPAAQTPILPGEDFQSPKPSLRARGIDIPRERPEVLQRVTEELHNKVDNWHGLDFSRFGRLILHASIRVGKDRHSWQDLDCYLFSEMLICVKERKGQGQSWDSPDPSASPRPKCTLKGSILIRKHLKQVEVVQEQNTLTLSLSVAELPYFHLLFSDSTQLENWRRALLNINQIAEFDEEQDTSGSDEDDYTSRSGRPLSSLPSSTYGAGRSNHTAPTDYTTHSRAGAYPAQLHPSIHVPLDVVLVIPISSSMQGLKISLLRDVLRFLVSNLGEQDRMGLVTFGSSGGSMPIVGMTSKAWGGWPKVLEQIRPQGQKSLRADVIEGANVAVDLLMQRKSANPLSSIILISDSATSESESVDFVVSRAEAAKITIHSFGLGLTHKPDTMIELSTRTKATYTYVKDWMMLRECIAGCLGSLQSISHQNVKLKLRLPEGTSAKFVKISGALQIIKRASGRDAEASLGDLRFGDKRDILVQLAMAPDTSSPEQVSGDPWDTLVSGLEALGGPLDSDGDMRSVSVEEVPLLQADLVYGDILREGTAAQLPRPSLLAITMLPAPRKQSVGRPGSPPIPPHPSVVQRRMELLTSDMLTRALTLVTRGQPDRANHLLTETRSILKGLGKGGLPPLPPPPSARLPPTPSMHGSGHNSPVPGAAEAQARRTPSPPRAELPTPFTPAAGIDPSTITALDAELESALEWISHPAVFGRDSRKAVLQAIGVISSQRGYTFRTPAEGLWATRIPGIKRLNDRSKEWREAADESLMEEA